MARVLTKPEIDQLYEFVAVKEIPYYDVQSEIVDHLASMMEKRWAEGSKLNLEQMFLEVHKDFGESEWRQIWVSRQKAMWKQLWFEAKSLLTGFFRWPLFLPLLLAIPLVQQMVQKHPEHLEVLIYTPLVISAGLLIFSTAMYISKLSAYRYLSSDAYLQIFAVEFWGAFLFLRLLHHSVDYVKWNNWLFAVAYVALVLLLIVIPIWLRMAGVRRSIERHRRLTKLS
ncbi:MAG: hypothetical protein KTR30_39295 [Saprospiraceae bacterium]|nr:hypothetical protein [Saprospiraceae bacterium]